MKAQRFKVVFEPDDGGWHAHIPSVKGCRTWGKTLDTARRHIREALATCTDVLDDADEVASNAVLVEELRLPARAMRALEHHRVARKRADREAAIASEATIAAASALAVLAKLSLRDAGALLGLSAERVRQLVDAKKSAHQPRRAVAKAS